MMQGSTATMSELLKQGAAIRRIPIHVASLRGYE